MSITPYPNTYITCFHPFRGPDMYTYRYKLNLLSPAGRFDAAHGSVTVVDTRAESLVVLTSIN
ncbi:hypothetical protein BC826DRAFT_1061844 [Russula brevipes]|nr:hypothetical protein BC826DRAFT_1061844 [Russula brevipes]